MDLQQDFNANRIVYVQGSENDVGRMVMNTQAIGMPQILQPQMQAFGMHGQVRRMRENEFDDDERGSARSNRRGVVKESQALQGRFSGRLETKADEQLLADECSILGIILGLGQQMTLAKLCRLICRGEVREVIEKEQQEKDEKLYTANRLLKAISQDPEVPASIRDKISNHFATQVTTSNHNQSSRVTFARRRLQDLPGAVMERDRGREVRLRGELPPPILHLPERPSSLGNLSSHYSGGGLMSSGNHGPPSLGTLSNYSAGGSQASGDIPLQSSLSNASQYNVSSLQASGLLRAQSQPLQLLNLMQQPQQQQQQQQPQSFQPMSLSGSFPPPQNQSNMILVQGSFEASHIQPQYPDHLQMNQDLLRHGMPQSGHLQNQKMPVYVMMSNMGQQLNSTSQQQQLGNMGQQLNSMSQQQQPYVGQGAPINFQYLNPMNPTTSDRQLTDQHSAQGVMP